MARTHTAPWDYYRPAVDPITLAEWKDLDARIKTAEDSLKEINTRYFWRWKWANDKLNRRNYYQALCQELDTFECSCEPDGPTCPGCRKAYKVAKEN